MNRLNKQPMKNTDLGFGHYEDQWWLGAKSYSHHNEHQPGSWTWEHLNATVDWFDWAPHEPDDYHRQQCLTYLRYQYDPFYQTYEWNDWTVMMLPTTFVKSSVIEILTRFNRYQKKNYKIGLIAKLKTIFHKFDFPNYNYIL